MSVKNAQVWTTMALCLAIAQISGAADPIVYYSFDELGATVTDESGNGRDGIPNGGLELEDEGQFGKCFRFNGTDAYVELDRPVQDDFSLLAWIKTSDSAPGTTQAYQGNGLFWSDVGGVANDLVVGVINTKLSFFAGNPDTSVNSNADVVIDEWVHIAAVRHAESGTMSVYINGQLDNSITHANAGALDAQPLMAIGANTLDNRYFNGLMDEILIYDVPLTEDEIQTAMAGLGAEYAADPSPADELTDVLRDSVLRWAPGEFAQNHDVYLGTVWEDVNSATTPLSSGQSANSFDPGILEFGQTYFWRVDEVNGAPDFTVFKGKVWSFTVEPFSYPIENVAASASSSHAENMGPEKTIDGSGLNELEQHGNDATHMWLSGMGDPTPSIQYEFDQAYKLHEMWVWNSNQVIESFFGLGAKDVTIETSVDGTNWTALEGPIQFAQATGALTYTANTFIDFAGAMAKYVKITILSGYGMMPQYGLSEVRFFFLPVQAREPQPAAGTVVADADVVLTWRAGREAASHEVYLGTDPTDLALQATVDEASYDLSSADLQYGTTYYWQINEGNEAATPTAHASDIWNFTTADYKTIDDFESYDDDCNRIFFAWQDGWGHNGGENIDDCDVPAYGGNGTGSLVGNAISPFAEQTIVHSGGQSMPLGFEGADSEAQLVFSPAQDWTKGGVTILVLHTYGDPGNTSGQLYVKVNHAKVAYDGDGNNIRRARWTQWNIDLASLGTNLSNVTSISVGVEGAATGMIFVDDIRLYQVAPALPEAADPGNGGLVAYYALDSNADDGSGNGHHGTLEGGAQWVQGVRGEALQFNGSTSYVEVADAPALDMTDAITIAAWVNAYSFGDWRGFVTKGVNNSPYAMQMWGDGALRFGWNWGTASAGAVGDGIMNSNGKMALDEWTHVAVTYDGSALSFYLNGGLDTQETVSFVMGTSDENLIVGADFPGGDEYYEGAMDEIHIYNRALTPGEVMFLGDLLP